MTVQAVIFDCDGVLVDSEVIAIRVWVEMAAELGYRLDPDEALRVFKGGKLTHCIAWLEERLGRPVPDAFARDFRARSALRFRAELRPIAGVRSVVQGLDIPFCVASNGPREKMDVSLKVAGLMDLFEGRIFSAYELNVWKPDPGLFIGAAEGLGVAPEQCAVVEDSLPGVQAGVAAGMTVFGFAAGDDAGELAGQGAVVFREMAELPRLLAGESPCP